MNTYIVKTGDSLSKIAQRYGLKSWQEIYNHPSNAAFRARRPNPNLIHPGDKLTIPTTTRGTTDASLTPSSKTARYGKLGKYENAMRKELAKTLRAQEQKAFFDFLEKTKQLWDNAFFVANGGVDGAIHVVMFYKLLRSLKLTLSDMRSIVAMVAEIRDGGALWKAAIKPGGKLAQALSRVRITGEYVGLLGLFVQCEIHKSRGDYVAMASEIFGFALGVAFPLAGLLDSIESLFSTIDEEWKNPKLRRFFKSFRHMNVLGLVRAGIDSAGTMLQIIITRDLNPDREARLLERLSKSPMSAFLKIAEDCDRALRAFEQMPEAEFREVMTANNLANWIKYELTGKLP